MIIKTKMEQLKGLQEQFQEIQKKMEQLQEEMKQLIETEMTLEELYEWDYNLSEQTEMVRVDIEELSIIAGNIRNQIYRIEDNRYVNGQNVSGFPR